MKKSFLAATASVLVGATMLVGAAPAMAHDRVAFGVTIGAPVAVVPAPVPYVAPAPVVYGGPIVGVGAPYYYGHYYHGWHGGYGYRGGWGHGGYRGWHR